MSRLFWKLFLAIFLAQIATAWGMGALFWLEHRNDPARSINPPPRPGGPMPPPLHPPPQRGLPWQPLGVGLLASLVFAALLARHLSRPILSLREAFEAVEAGNFGMQLAPRMRGRHDELADLARQFDQTSARIRHLLSTQRRLLSDVSHEVRSPLARMQLAIDLARQQPEKTAAGMQRIEREAGRIDRLIEELLTLSRVEAGACGARHEMLSLNELMQEIVDDAAFEAAAKTCRVHFESGEDIQVRGHDELLQRAIENVVRNALRHGPAGSTITITLQRRDAAALIQVKDQGPGLPEAALSLIFEPFVRFGDHGGNDGHGLGLAITRQVMALHHGSVSAHNREGGGLCVTLSLPAQTQGRSSSASTKA